MQQKLLLFIGIVAIIAAIWSYLFITAPARETLDQRVQDVASQLRCPICQGESVADSPSDLARQMRGVIRQQLQEGKSNQEIIQYFVDRYGQQIVWSPPWQGFSLLAWLVPIGLLLFGTIVMFAVLRSWQRGVPASPAEEAGEAGEIDEAELQEYQSQLAEEPMLQEIELDYQLGNLTESDYQALRERYTRRALVALKSQSEHQEEHS